MVYDSQFMKEISDLTAQKLDKIKIPRYLTNLLFFFFFLKQAQVTDDSKQRPVGAFSSDLDLDQGFKVRVKSGGTLGNL